MEKQIITSLISYDKDRTGNPLMTKDGRPYTRLSIQTNLHGQQKLSGFASPATKDWRIGSEVEIKVTEARGTNGAVYFNFEVPKKDEQALSSVKSLEITVLLLKNRVEAIEKYLDQKRPIPPGTKVANTDLEYPIMEKAPNFDAHEYPMGDELIPF